MLYYYSLKVRLAKSCKTTVKSSSKNIVNLVTRHQ